MRRAITKIAKGIAFTLGVIVFVASFTILLVLLRANFPYPPLFERTPTVTTTPTPSLRYLREEEVVVVPAPHASSTTPSSSATVTLPVEEVLFEYVAITGGCGPHFEGECLNARSGPGTDYPSVAKLRSGMVLKVGGKVEREGVTWYKIVFDEWLRYPDRLKSDWYVAADYVEILLDEGDRTIDEHGHSSTSKRILVDRGEQKLYAYENDELVMEFTISTGLELTPTPRGTFTIFKKTPSRYMQGPLPYLTVSKYYDLPGVPWNLYFTEQGAVIHGAYWHDSFGRRYSSGCVNMRPDEARTLYTWAELGTTVTVRD